MIQFREGQTVRVRGTRSLVIHVAPSTTDPEIARLDLRVISGERPGATFSVISPIDTVVADDAPPLDLAKLTPFRVWERFHDAFRFELAPPPRALSARPQARITIEEYQRVPAARALLVPRPRILIADDVGLGKTIEAGLAYLELATRRRARRVLIVAPASICKQWRSELLEKFGIEFDIFNRDEIEAVRRSSEVGTNPFTLRQRVIISLDLAKMDATFGELRGTTWDLAIIDEAHHVAMSDESDVTQNRRFAEWLATASQGLFLLSATPHDGSDATFASLIRLLEPRLVPPGALLQRSAIDPYIVRRLKRDIRSVDGSPRFVPRQPVEAVPVTLTPPERALHDDVIGAIALLREAAAGKKGEEKVRIEFLATIIRKRLASSRAALVRTIENRRAKVGQNLSALQTRRDLLRRARAGETLDEAEEAQLELDLHASVAAEQQRVGRARKRAEDERDLFEELERSVAALADSPESKVEILIGALKAIWAEDPHENVLIFSEYRDTVESLAASLRGQFGKAVIALHGESEDREAALARFSREGKIVLIATDFASEGLNLQVRCHTLIHYDLPWNPNRLEQRNGRVDRYGQQKAPRIKYLYSAQTYDGELLNILVKKIERQIDAIGSVGDVLGAFQPRRLDEIFSRSELTMSLPLRAEAEARIQDLIDSAVAPPSLKQIETQAVPVVTERRPDIGKFVAGAIMQCGGNAAIEEHELIVRSRPPTWREEDLRPRYALPGSQSDAPLLTEASAIFRSAVSAVRELRYDTKGDPRVAAVVRTGVAGPTLVATFVLALRSRDNEIVERLTAYAVSEAGEVSDGALLLRTSDAPEPNNLGTVARESFEHWWSGAIARCADHARVETGRWREALANERTDLAVRAKRQLGDWFAAECRRAREDAGLTALALPIADPPRVARKIKELEDQHNRQQAALEAFAEIDVAEAESVGVLLIVPAA